MSALMNRRYTLSTRSDLLSILKEQAVQNLALTEDDSAGSGIGAMLASQGDYKAALPYHLRACAVYDEYYFAVDSAIATYNYAHALYHLGRYQEADTELNARSVFSFLQLPTPARYGRGPASLRSCVARSARRGVDARRVRSTALAFAGQ